MQAISQNFDNSRGDLSDFLDMYQTFVRFLGNLLKFNNSGGDYSDFSWTSTKHVSDFLEIYQKCNEFRGNVKNSVEIGERSLKM